MSKGKYKIGDIVEIYDDGKRARRVQGEVVFNISDYHMLVKFTPWGYADNERDVDTYLVFYRGHNETCFFWHALNPRSPFFITDAEPTFFESEYCIVV